MGFSNKKTTKKETSKVLEDVTTTRTNPAYVEDALKGYTDKVTGLMSRDPTDFVAGANPLQTQAGAAAAGLGGWKGGMDSAMDLIGRSAARVTEPGRTGQVEASSLLDGLGDYENPYQQRVRDAALSEIDLNAGRTRAAQAASGARNGAFGGSRFALREAQTEGELARARSTADANLLHSGFETAADLADRDATRRQQAAFANQGAEAADLGRGLTAQLSDAERGVSAGGLMGGLATATGAGARDDVATQLGAGGTLRDIDAETRNAPIGLLGAIGNLLGQGQFGLMNGSNVNGVTNSDSLTKITTDPGLMAKIGQAIQTAASAAALASDADLKTDIDTLGFDDRGRRWVSWRYLWEAPDALLHTGVIAQEIRASDPEAVVAGPFGFLMVDYSKLESGQWRHS